MALSFKGKLKKYQEGGMIEGPPHEMGGVPVIQDGQPVAEVEGGERVFSVEDTQMMEQIANEIMNSGDENTANQMAMELGYMVVEMLARQESQGEEALTPEESMMMGGEEMMGMEDPYMEI